MSNWEPKDIIVVATAVVGLLGTLIVQIIQPLFAARSERNKTVEEARRKLYQEVIVHLDYAISALNVEDDEPNIRKAFQFLEKSRAIVFQHPVEISDDFRRACAVFLNKTFFEQDFEADLHNTRSVNSTISRLEKARAQALKVSRRELKMPRSARTRLYPVKFWITRLFIPRLGYPFRQSYLSRTVHGWWRPRPPKC